MLFNSLTFVVFFAVVVTASWSIRSWTLRKNLLVTASYIFYGAWNPPFAGARPAAVNITTAPFPATDRR